MKLRDSALEGEILQGVYQVEKRVGQGGTAWVYRGHHKNLGTPVAIKILFASHHQENKVRERFLREARIQYDMDHNHIVRVRDFIEERGLVGFVMEWCDAGDLYTWTQGYQRKLAPHELRIVFPPVLDALDYAHQQGVIHRDLKPQNILLCYDGKQQLVPKVTDFGIAKILDEDALTKTGSMIGTLNYIAPEQLMDSKHIDERADIYSVGVILYLLTTGRRPFVADQPPVLCAQILSKAPPSPTEAPAPLQPIILRCLEKEPNQRYANSRELRYALLRALDQIAPPPQNALSMATIQDPNFVLSLHPPSSSNEEQTLTPEPNTLHSYQTKTQNITAFQPPNEESTEQLEPPPPEIRRLSKKTEQQPMPLAELMQQLDPSSLPTVHEPISFAQLAPADTSQTNPPSPSSRSSQWFFVSGFLCALLLMALLLFLFRDWLPQ